MTNSPIFLSHSPDGALAVHWARRPSDGMWFRRLSPNTRTPNWSNWSPTLRPDPDLTLGNTGRTTRLPN